ncbi:DNA transfer protein [Helicobacter bizzozeronii CCUG 35545]|nr:DNA transfer protein [Helicobacter bizzozeronii CCUG 35545]
MPFFYALFKIPYTFLQQRYFPYRNRTYDLGVLVLLVMGVYLVLLDFQPSFLRAFVMAVGAFALFFSGVELLSFAFFVISGAGGFSPLPKPDPPCGLHFVGVRGVLYFFVYQIHPQNARLALCPLV